MRAPSTDATREAVREESSWIGAGGTRLDRQLVLPREPRALGWRHLLAAIIHCYDTFAFSGNDSGWRLRNARAINKTRQNLRVGVDGSSRCGRGRGREDLQFPPFEPTHKGTWAQATGRRVAESASDWAV